MATIEVDIDLSDYLDELKTRDVIKWLAYEANANEVREVREYLNYDHNSILEKLCRELDNYGVESFLNMLIYETSHANMECATTIRQRINEYLEKQK